MSATTVFKIFYILRYRLRASGNKLSKRKFWSGRRLEKTA